MDKESIYESRHRYEEAWKAGFAKRLKEFTASRGIGEETLSEMLECSPQRVRDLLAGRDYPLVTELLRLCYLCYDADEILFGARAGGFSYLFRGKFE